MHCGSVQTFLVRFTTLCHQRCNCYFYFLSSLLLSSYMTCNCKVYVTTLFCIVSIVTTNIIDAIVIIIIIIVLVVLCRYPYINAQGLIKTVRRPLAKIIPVTCIYDQFSCVMYHVRH